MVKRKSPLRSCLIATCIGILQAMHIDPNTIGILLTQSTNIRDADRILGFKLIPYNIICFGMLRRLHLNIGSSANGAGGR